MKQQYKIFGYITETDGNTPVEGVWVEANNGVEADITDSDGYYQLIVEYGWSGIVDPNKMGYTFDPNHRIYETVIADHNDGYTAIPEILLIAGYVFDSATLSPLENVLVSPENEGGVLTSTYYGGGFWVTDDTGYYAVSVDPNWSGDVSLSKYAYTFEPSRMTYTNIVEDIFQEQAYLGTLMTFTITGSITDPTGDPIEGVLVTADAGGGSAITDPNGVYEVWVDYDWSGQITPQDDTLIFDPNHREWVHVLEDIDNQHYTARSIYDLDGNGVIDLGDLGLFSDHWLLSGSSLLGDYHPDEENVINLLDFAAFSEGWRD
jgi:hypothetical protein